MSKPIYILSASRSAIGGFGGSLADIPLRELGAMVARDTLNKASITDPTVVSEVIVGNVLGAGQGMNIARQISLTAGLNPATPAYTVNKVCGSGLKAINLGAGEIALGNADIILAGGIESMSQAAFVSLQSRWGAKMGHSELRDLMISDGLTDAFSGQHMGITAENLAERFKIGREAQDQFAADSQSKTAQALDAGHFKAEITPIPLMKRGKQVGVFEVDEYPRKGTTVAALSALRPAFKKDGTVTAGNSSGLNDGAAFVVLASEQSVKKMAFKPIAELVAWASGGVDPEVMGIGPVEAVRNLLSKTQIKLAEIDLIEANEAFAVQAMAVNKSLEWDTSRVNVCGGAIALGHPIGASGARILVTLVNQMQRCKKRYGLATLCIGGGQGIATLIKLV